MAFGKYVKHGMAGSCNGRHRSDETETLKEEARSVRRMVAREEARGAVLTPDDRDLPIKEREGQ